jgi:peptide/nickel transport system ATP-binding protein
VVLYHGAVVEAGDVDLVVKQPRHPYTQLLISSIPLASAERNWTAANGPGAATIQPAGSAGCKFAERCPHATAPCLQAAPPLFHPERYRAVACYLHHTAPTLAAAEMGHAFTEPARLLRGG